MLHACQFWGRFGAHHAISVYVFACHLVIQPYISVGRGGNAEAKLGCEEVVCSDTGISFLTWDYYKTHSASLVFQHPIVSRVINPLYTRCDTFHFSYSVLISTHLRG